MLFPHLSTTCLINQQPSTLPLISLGAVKLGCIHEDAYSAFSSLGLMQNVEMYLLFPPAHVTVPSFLLCRTTHCHEDFATNCGPVRRTAIPCLCFAQHFLFLILDPHPAEGLARKLSRSKDTSALGCCEAKRVHLCPIQLESREGCSNGAEMLRAPSILCSLAVSRACV